MNKEALLLDFTNHENGRYGREHCYELIITNKCLIDFSLPPNNKCTVKTIQDIFSKLKKYSDERTLLGEFFDQEMWTSQSSISLANVSHLIVNLKLKGTKIIGDIEVVDTPRGKIVKAAYYQANANVIFLPRCEPFSRNKPIEEIYTWDILLLSNAQKIG